MGLAVLEKLLKQTEFKKDAADIARKLERVGITDLALLDNAPTLLRSTKVWGHDIYSVIAAVRDAALRQAQDATSKPEEVKPKTAIKPEPESKPAGGSE
jgi:uncharacterized membrane protein YukC